MYRFGRSSDTSPSKHGVTNASSSTFVRRAGGHARLRHWLAGIPLIAVAALTFNGPAPAEMSGEITHPVAAAVAPQEARWSLSDARKLIDVIQESDKEGLDPANYQLAALRATVDAEDKGPALDALASAAALSLAHDYAYGRIQDKAAFDWHIEQQADPNLLAANLNDALDAGKVGKWLRSLLPDNDQYRALKAAYAAPDGANREQLRANLERWRWMPRDMGKRYIYVNIPSYRLELMDGGVEEASYNVVVGAPKTPTPQLALHAQSVVANPSWTLPPSVLKENGWRSKGFSVTKRTDGSLMVVQAPGPRNALGRIKIDMPNPMAIYLHDTPAKAAFNKTDRALSHGCVRVQNIEELAGLLSDSGDLSNALADPAKTKVLQLQKSVPVFIVYFTAQADADGTVHYLNDPYRRDTALLDRMGAGGQNAVRMAAR